MTKDGVSIEEMQKTGALLGVANLLMSPFYYMGSKIGLTFSLLTTTALIYTANEIGKENRPVENAVNKTNTFFSNPTQTDIGAEIDNTFRNIVTGGAVLFDKVIPR